MQTIIVGTDFSMPGNNAVNYALELAKFFSTKLVLVNAFSLPLGGYDLQDPLGVIADLQKYYTNELEELKKEIIKKNYDFGIDCVSEVGTPSDIIKDVASRYSADLVVMGMVGEGSYIKKYLLGSSALRAARDLTIPMLMIPEGATYHRIRRICFACDMDKMDETTLLHTAKYFGTAFDAEIELVTIKKSNNEIAWNEKETYALVEKRLQDIKHKNVYIKDNNVWQALEYYFKFHKTDLVLVNPKKHTFFQTLFDESITKKLVFNVEVPLLIIH